MRSTSCLILLAACAGAFEPMSTTEPDPASSTDGRTESSDDDPLETERVESLQPCPSRPLVVADMGLDVAPRLSRELWLDLAVSMADSVVDGAIDEARLTGEVLCGEDPSDVLHPIHREVRGRGVWLVVRAPNGFVVLNPDRAPIERSEWDALRRNATARDASPTREHASGSQIHRTIQQGDREVWHGVEVAQSGSEVHVVLHERGESHARIAFDARGIERVVLNPASGRGFMLQNARGSLWRYAHYVDGQLEGTAQTFERGTTELREDVHYRGGRMHGRVRYWEDGRLVRDVTYEDGLIAPVVPWSGASGVAQIHYGPDGSVSYSAPRDVIDGIRVGMHAREVARLLQLPVSPAMGVRFPSYRCEEALTIRFRGQRVSERELLPNGAHCM